MTDIEPVLKRLGLQQYLDVLVAEGFDTWTALSDIQESDLEYLNIKLGHRRKLQRAVAEWRGLATDKSLEPSSQEGTAVEGLNVERLSQESASAKEQAPPVATEQKRKYRRHPKPDDNAPDKPPSAYVLFSNKVREDARADNLSFTEIARLVGDRWQKLEPGRKDRFESHASALKETYNSQLNEYKKTDEYTDYNQYLVEFKAKHSSINDTKRPKLESNQSSSVSVPSPGTSGGVIQFTGHSHARGTSIGSVSTVSCSAKSGATSATPMQGIALPYLNAPVGRRPSPPYHTSQDTRRLGHFSSHSSTSEDSSSAKAEHSDTLSRAASLSLTASSIEPPPLVIPGQRTGWTEYTHPSPYGSASAPRHPQKYSPSMTTATSPASTTSSIPPSAVGGDWWRDRGQESTRLPSGGSTAAGSMAISQLVASSHGEKPGSMVTSRALPPPRQLSGITTQLPYNTLDTKSTAGHAPHSPINLTPIRGRRSGELPSRSENEAADTLAGLAERKSGAYQTWPSRPRAGQ